MTAIEDTSICILNLADIKKTIMKNGLFSMNLIEKLSEATDMIILDSLEIKRKHYIGMTTENVIRTLSEFKKDGIIRTFGKDIDIVDGVRLRSISEHG